MLRMPAFEFRPARTVAEAVEAYAEAQGRAMYLAGGTDLVPNMKRRQFEPPVLVGIRRIAELKETATQEDDELRLGSGLTLRQLVDDPLVASRYPGLAEAAGQVANLQIQRMATLGGNLCVDTRCNYYNQTYEWRRSIGFCMKKDGSGCLVAPGSSKCWAVSSSDTAPILIALRAEITLTGAEGSRRIPLVNLYQDDGIRYLTRRPDEILTAVNLPAGNGMRSTYTKLRRRGSFDFPILGVGATMSIRDGQIADARLVLGAVHTHPLVVEEVSELLRGQTPSRELFEEAANLAYKRSTPLDNTDLTLYWRKRMTRVTVRRTLERLAAD